MIFAKSKITRQKHAKNLHPNNRHTTFVPNLTKSYDHTDKIINKSTERERKT